MDWKQWMKDHAEIHNAENQGFIELEKRVDALLDRVSQLEKEVF